jgi:hypothetical protein
MATWILEEMRIVFASEMIINQCVRTNFTKKHKDHTIEHYIEEKVSICQLTLKLKNLRIKNVFRRRGKFDKDLIMNKAESKVETMEFTIADILCMQKTQQ